MGNGWNTIDRQGRCTDDQGLKASVARRRVVHDGGRCAASSGARVRPVRRSSGPRRSGGLRLTRRGRVVLILLPLAALLATALLAIAPPTAQASGSTGAALTQTETEAETDAGGSVTVRPGDTLWAIAERAAPGLDPRDGVFELEQVNRLADAAIRPGQVLHLPSTFPAGP